MPTFITPRMVFIHVPKTGGTWLTHAVSAAGVAVAAPDPEGGRSYSPHGHADLRDTGVTGRVSVAFVRHPLDWWRSYWGHRMRAGWVEDNPVDAAAHDDFNEFVLRMLDRHAGHFTELVRRFVGLPEPEVDFVGRYERLTVDAERALRLGGERFHAGVLRAHPRENANDYARFPASYRPEVAALLAQAERETIERFYPYEPVPQRLLSARGSARGPAPRARAAGEQLAVLGCYARGLERTLERARAREREQQLQLQRLQLQLEHATIANERLRASRLIRYSRPLRTRYYAVRAAARRRRSARAPSRAGTTPQRPLARARAPSARAGWAQPAAPPSGGRRR